MIDRFSNIRGRKIAELQDFFFFEMGIIEGAVKICLKE
jgi:hypothetical protein